MSNLRQVVFLDPNDATTTRFAEMDVEGRYPVTISEPHHQIHESKTFFYSDCITLALSATQDYLLTVPNTPLNRKHFTFRLAGTDKITVAFFEGTDKTGTSLQTSYNNNRDSVAAATMTIHKGSSSASGETDGTDIHPDCGGANKQSGVVDRSEEILLKTNTKYIVRVTSGANSNSISVHLDWYEHTTE